MTAVESRLAATLAKHRAYTGICGDTECTAKECAGQVFAGWEGHAAHVAQVIASSDDLAVIEVPVVAHKAVGVTDAEVFAGAAWRIEEGYAPGGRNMTAAVVELLRRVAKAAEAVSDRG